MARSSSSTGSRFASANLNDLYGKQVHPGSGGGTGAGLGSKLRYGHSSHSHGGMLVLARPVRTPPGHHRSKSAPQKLTVPAPVNLPSLRKEHAGNDPSISLVGGSGTSGWKQQQSLVDDASTVADGGSGSFRSNGWGMSSQVHSLEQGPNSADGQLRPGRYTPPAARGPSESPLPIRHAPPPTSSMVLRGEDFPTLRDALPPFNPVPQRQRELQQRQRDRQREMKEEQQKLQQLSQNQAEKEQDWSSQLALQPHAKQDRSPKEEGYKRIDAKENQKPSDLSLRPGPVQYTHASNWAEDERDTSSAFRAADWEEGPRFSSSQPPPSRTPLYRDERLNNTRRDYVYNRDPGDFSRGRDFGWERDGHFGRNDISRDWRTGAFDRSEVEMGREYNPGRDFRGSGWGQREGFVTRDSFAGRGREGYLRDDFFSKSGFGDRGRFGGRGGFDFGMDFGRLRSPGLVHGMSSHSEDAFMRDFPELGGIDLRSRNKLRKKEEAGDIYYHDPERESFESELERVQKEQEQERLRKVEERERAIELARKEQEERERAAREEEERQRRLEEEAREAAARTEREALEAASKMEEAKRTRNAEKQKMQEEEERRKENARKKLMELEERIAKREMEKKQGAPQGETADRELDAQDDRMPRPLSSSGMSRSRQDSPSSRVRSPGVYGAYAAGRDASRDSERARFPISWKREPLDGHFSVAQDHEGHREADPYYGNSDGFSGGDVLRKERERTGEKWLANGERNSYSPRSAFTSPNFLEREERWSRRGRDRPFSPPSPTYGSSFDDGIQYGRFRQSLPKQPRVPPPPMRTSLQRQMSMKDSQPAGLGDKPELETQIEQDILNKSFSEPDQDMVAGEVHLAGEQSDKHIVEAEEMVLEGTAAVESSEEEEALELSAVEKHVVETEPTMGEDDAFSEERSGDFQSSKDLSSENDNLESVDGEVSEGAHMGAELSELVDSLVVVPKVESEPVAEPQVSTAAELELPAKEAASQSELASVHQPVRPPSAESAPLLPSPLPAMQPAPGDGKHHVFGQAAYMPPQMPLLEPRPRLETHPDRPMTLQFGLLPGTSLFQGSVPAIQIGSIQMPLQLHPPIGHHVTHMRPPQFQFGQIGQQPPLMPSFTVHPQAMMQPLNMEGPPPMGAQPIPGHQFHLQPHPDRTFWAHQYGQPNQVQHNQQAVDARPDKAAAPLQESEARQEPQHLEHSSSSSTLEEHVDLAASADKGGASKQERRRHNRRDFKATNHGVHYVRKNSKDGKEMEAELSKQNQESGKASVSHRDEDDFIEVRSKRQMLNERRGEKEKQNRSKSKFVKAKEQTTLKVKDQLLSKQKNLTKPQVASAKQPLKLDPLRNSSLDAVVSTVRSHQASLSNPEVGYEKRTKSPQPLQNDSLSTDAAQAGNLGLAGAWGFRNEVVDLQVQLDEVLDSASAAAKERNAATISSLLAGEKIQFGAVTMPAFVSPVGWRLGSTQPEDFLTSSKEDVAETSSFDKVKPPRDAEDNISNVVDSEAEAEAAASAIAVAAIGSDDFVHNTDQHVPSHGIIGSASKNGSPVASNGAAVRSDDPMSVSLPADLSVDPPLALRGPSHCGQHLASIPGGFPGMEMGNASNVEQGGGRPPAGPGPNWPGVDSFYGAPPSYTGPFINHGPIPSIPPQTLVYTNPFGVGQFGQLYMGPLPSVKQPDWKHTPVSSTAVSGMSSAEYGRVLYAQHGNRHLGHDPSVISVVTPPGPFDVYRDVAFQSHWSHIPPHMHNAPGFSMQLRHPPPPFHVQHHQQQQQQQQQQLVESAAESNLTTIKVPGDQFPDELGLGDSMSSCANAASSAVEAPPKAPGPVSSLPSAMNIGSNTTTNKQVHSRAVQARPVVAGYQSPAFSVPVPAPVPALAPAAGASPARRPVEKRTTHQQQQQQQGVAAKVNPTGWGNQGRKAGGPQGRTPANERDKSGSSVPVSTKLKQVYVAKPPSSSLGLTATSSNETVAAAVSEIFTAEAVQT